MPPNKNGLTKINSHVSIWQHIDEFIHLILESLSDEEKRDRCLVPFQPEIPATVAERHSFIQARVNPFTDGDYTEADLRGELLETIQETGLPIDINQATSDIQYQLSNHLYSMSAEQLFAIGIFGRPSSMEEVEAAKRNMISWIYRNMMKNN